MHAIARLGSTEVASAEAPPQRMIALRTNSAFRPPSRNVAASISGSAILLPASASRTELDGTARLLIKPAYSFRLGPIYGRIQGIVIARALEPGLRAQSMRAPPAIGPRLHLPTATRRSRPALTYY